MLDLNDTLMFYNKLPYLDLNDILLRKKFKPSQPTIEIAIICKPTRLNGVDLLGLPVFQTNSQ